MELEGCRGRGRDHYRQQAAFCIVLISVMRLRSDVLLTFYIHHTHVIDMRPSKLIAFTFKLHSLYSRNINLTQLEMLFMLFKAHKFSSNIYAEL